MAAVCILCCSFYLCGLLLIVERLRYRKANDPSTSVFKKTGTKYRKKYFLLELFAYIE